MSVRVSQLHAGDAKIVLGFRITGPFYYLTWLPSLLIHIYSPKCLIRTNAISIFEISGCWCWPAKLSRHPISVSFSKPYAFALAQLTMPQIALSAEVITSIVFGLLQIFIGLVSLWQQREFRQANRMFFLVRLWQFYSRTHSSRYITRKTEYVLKLQGIHTVALRHSFFNQVTPLSERTDGGWVVAQNWNMSAARLWSLVLCIYLPYIQYILAGSS